MHVGMLRMEGIGIFMTCVILPLLLCCVSKAQSGEMFIYTECIIQFYHVRALPKITVFIIK